MNSVTFLFMAIVCALLPISGCQKNEPPAAPVEVRSEQQLDAEYRVILTEAGLAGGATPTTPAQIEPGQYGQLLTLAAGHGSPELLARLLAARSEINLNEKYDGRTLLHAAAASLQAGNCNLLLERGLDPNARDALGRTPLHLVVAQAPGEVLARLLLSRGATVDLRDEQGLTPLLWAAPASIKLLADKGADLSAQDTNGNSALHWAAYRRAHEAAGSLLTLGVPPDLQNSAGKTALHAALELNDPQMAQLFIKAGAKTDITDTAGFTTLQLAEKSVNKKLRQVFGLSLP